MHRKQQLLLLFITALVFRLIFLAVFRDTAIDNGRMLIHYDLANSLTETGHFYLDTAFFTKASLYMYHLKPQRNIDYYKLRALFPEPPSYDTNPDITDTWGYAALLGIVWKLTRFKSYLIIQILQVLIDCGATVLLYLILGSMFGFSRRVLVAAYTYALFPPAALMTVIANRDYYAAWCTILSLFLFIKGCKHPTRPWLFNLLAGISIAFFCWLRPFIILLPFAFGGWMLAYSDNSRFKRAFTTVLLMSIPILLLFILPFVYQFHKRYNTVNFLAGIGGHALWTGMGAFSQKYQFVRNDLSAFNRADQIGYQRENGGIYSPVYGNALAKDAVGVIKQDPGFYLAAMVRRYIRFSFARPLFPLSERDRVSFLETKLPLNKFVTLYPVYFVEKCVKRIISILFPLLAVLSLFLYPQQRASVVLLIALWQYIIITLLPLNIDDRVVTVHYFPVVVLSALSCAALCTRLRTLGHPGANVRPS